MTPRVGAGLLAGVFAVSWAAIFIRLAHAPALTVAAWRLAFAAAPLALAAALGHRAQLRSLGRRRALPLLGAGLALAAQFGLWVSSLELTSVASSVALVTTTPVWVALVGERPPRVTVLGMVVAMAGSVVIAGADFTLDSRALAGDGLALAGAWCMAGYLVLGKRVRAGLGVAAYVGVVYPVAALVLLAAALASGAPLTTLEPGQWAWLLALALVPQLIGHSLLNWALAHVSAALVAIAILGESIFSTLLAIVLLHEVPSPSRALGAALVLSGVATAAIGEARRARR